MGCRMIESDADVFNPLLLAVSRRRKPEILQLFLDNNVNINYQCDCMLFPDVLLFLERRVYRESVETLFQCGGLNPTAAFYCPHNEPIDVDDIYCRNSKISTCSKRCGRNEAYQNLSIYTPKTCIQVYAGSKRSWN